MKLRHLLLAAGLLVAGWLAFFADKSPVNEVVDATKPVPLTQKKADSKTGADNDNQTVPPVQPIQLAPAAKTEPDTMSEQSKKSTSKSDLQIASIIERKLLIASEYKGGNSFFVQQSWTPPPPPTVVVKPPPPPAPTAPPLPFRYVGKKTDNGVVEVYLSMGDKVLFVQEKMVIESTYRVDAISATTMTFTYLPLHQVQTLPIGSAD